MINSGIVQTELSHRLSNLKIWNAWTSWKIDSRPILTITILMSKKRENPCRPRSANTAFGNSAAISAADRDAKTVSVGKNASKIWREVGDTDFWCR